VGIRGLVRALAFSVRRSRRAVEWADGAEVGCGGHLAGGRRDVRSHDSPSQAWYLSPGARLRVLAMRSWKVVLLALGILAAIALLALACCVGLFYGIAWVGSRTAYAPGFSEAAFNQIRVGMTESEVVGLVGKPLGKWVDPKGPWRSETLVTFYYTEPDPRGNECYYRRFVTFNESGRVSEIISDFWID
jgi:hypothetical protein